jgi:hypothetical protein
LLSSPTSAGFKGNGTTATLNVLQSDPAQIRDLEIGFGSLRTVRAETAVNVPLVQAQLRLEDGRLYPITRDGNEDVFKSSWVTLTR